MTNSELLNEHPPIDKAVMAFLGGILPGLEKVDGTAKPKTPEEAWADADEQARDVMRAGVAAVIRTQLDELRAQYDERLADLQMLAFKWMDAHDKLKAGLPYELPKPADVPDTMAQLDELRAALKPFAKCAEQLKNRTDFGDKVIVSVGPTVLTLDDFNQARKALGGTNVG